jgi:CheY-like chemotaxis protein
MGSKKKILIVDDEKNFTDMLFLNLESTGKYDLKVENNPHFALQTALAFDPDLILLDVIMPDMEGPDVLQQFKSQELLQQIPVVFLTATVTREEVGAEGDIIGGHTFVAKPSSLYDLMKVIDRALLLN